MIDLWPNEITYWEQLASVDALKESLKMLASLVATSGLYKKNPRLNRWFNSVSDKGARELCKGTRRTSKRVWCQKRGIL